jgi:hypothetical protein
MKDWILSVEISPIKVDVQGQCVGSKVICILAEQWLIRIPLLFSSVSKISYPHLGNDEIPSIICDVRGALKLI